MVRESASPPSPPLSSPALEAAVDPALIPPLDESGGLGAVLANRNFLALWAGQVFSQLADKVYLVLMIAIISSQFEAPGQTISGWVSAVMIAFTLPAMLLGSVAGVFVDRWPKLPVLVLTNLARGGLVMALPFLLWLTVGQVGLGGVPLGFNGLLVVTFLVSCLTQFFAPAEQATIPLLVPRQDLLSANSLYTTTMMASVIVGFAVGEPLLALASAWLPTLGLGAEDGKTLVVGAGYALAGLCLLLVRPPQRSSPACVPGAADPTVNAHPHVWQDIRDGLAYINQQVQVRGAIIQLVLLSSVFAALAVLAVRLAEMMPSLEASQFGFLLAAGGVGMGVGSLVVGQFGQRWPRQHLSLAGSLVMAAALGTLAVVSQGLVLVLGAIFVLGLGAAAVGIPMQTIIQEQTPEAMRGKVFGLQNNLVNIALSLPLALTGVAEATLGLGVVCLGLAGLVAAGGGVTWYIADNALKEGHLGATEG